MRKRTKEEWVELASAMHNGKYSYLKSDYKSALDKISIICPTHGTFKMSISNHRLGSGCPSCAKSGFDEGKKAFFYIFTGEVVTKVGITNRNAARRLAEVNRSGKGLVIHKAIPTSGAKARSVETSMLAWLNARYTQLNDGTNGSTECFLNVNLAELEDQVKHLFDN
jgi:hypothetical protein